VFASAAVMLRVDVCAMHSPHHDRVSAARRPSRHGGHPALPKV